MAKKKKAQRKASTGTSRTGRKNTGRSTTSGKKSASKKKASGTARQKSSAAMSKNPHERDIYPEGESPSIRRVMMPRDTNAVGTIFGGTILAEIDLAAATEAHKHHAGMVVTVSMEKIDFKAPVYVGDLVSFFTKTVRVGRSSITVQVSVWAQRRFGGGRQAHVTEAQVTMVAVDTNFRPVPVGTIPS